MEFILKSEYIDLMALLKVTGLVSTGGQAGVFISEGEVTLNGTIELRKRAKIRKGDVVQFQQETIHIL